MSPPAPWTNRQVEGSTGNLCDEGIPICVSYSASATIWGVAVCATVFITVVLCKHKAMMSPPLSGCWLPEADCPMCQFGKLRSQLRNPYLIWSMQNYLRCSNFEKIWSREKCRKVILVCVRAVSIGPEENSHDGNSPLFFKLFEVRNIWRKEKGTRTMVFPLHPWHLV